MSQALPIPLEFTASVASVAAATDITLDTGRGTTSYVRLQRVQILHTAGSAATFTPSIGNVAVYSTATIDMKYQGGATAVATMFDVSGIGAWIKTDSTGKIYLRPTPNAGADNTFAYSIIVEVI